jgi:hypothetical protein
VSVGRVILAALGAAVVLCPAAAGAQVKFDPTPPPPPPPIFETNPSHIIQTLYKPVVSRDGRPTLASGDDLVSIAERLNQAMREALKTPAPGKAAVPNPAGSKPAASDPAETAPVVHVHEHPAASDATPAPTRTPAPAPAGRVRLRWNDRLELRWPDEIEPPDADASGDRISLTWK